MISCSEGGVVLSVQLVIILIYFALTLIIGFWNSHRTKGSDAFHGTQMGVFAIVCVSCGEWLGGTATTGVAEYGFLYGLSGAWYTIANGLGIFLLGMLFAKLYRSIGSITVPGIVERYFGINARIISSILLIIVMLAVGVSQMIAAGKLGQGLLGLDFTLSCIAFTVIFTVYTLAGGMNAVASTNKMHLFVMYAGVISGAVLAINKVGGFSEMVQILQMTDMAEGTNHFGMFSIGIPKVSSWIIASILGAETAQAGLQPVLAAKDVPSAKKSCLITALIVAPFGFFSAFMGMAAKAMSSQGLLLGVNGVNVVDAKLAFSTMMIHLPKVAGGLILASILAAILSTVSPIILASATLFTKDIYQRKLHPEATNQEVIHTSRIMTAISGVICCVLALVLVNASTVLDLVYSAYSLRGVLFIILLYGIYGKTVSGKAACWSMVVTSIAMVFWAGFKVAVGHYPLSMGSFEITDTYAAVIVAIVAGFVFGKIWPKTKEELEKAKGKA